MIISTANLFALIMGVGCPEFDWVAESYEDALMAWSLADVGQFLT